MFDLDSARLLIFYTIMPAPILQWNWIALTSSQESSDEDAPQPWHFGSAEDSLSPDESLSDDCPYPPSLWNNYRIGSLLLLSSSATMSSNGARDLLLTVEPFPS